MRDGWIETTLGELCEIYQPETISKAQMDDTAPYIVYGANGPIGRYSRFNHEEPEVVVTCRGATCGVVNMTPPNCWITGNAMVVKPRNNRSTKGFLFWALQISVDVQATISGSAQRHPFWNGGLLCMMGTRVWRTKRAVFSSRKSRTPE